MLFSSAAFIYLFLPLVLLIYYVFLRKSRPAQNVFLFIVSLFFYAWGEPKFVLVMLLSIVVNWLSGLAVNKLRSRKKAVYLVLAANVFINLGILFIYKYLNFTANTLNSLFNIDFNIPQITLPIGISFFTFQAMSYVIDVYREKGKAQKNIINVGLYIAFFPQLIAGPIVRYETIADQIINRRENINDVTSGFTRFCTGLAKKVLLSNNLALLADNFFNGASDSSLSAAAAWLGAIAYTLQIFFDFSGYSDMAIGLGKMFGFHFLENFNYPYISKSVSEFWRRWHISLGSWFRDYLYFPLGGSRVSKPRLFLNLFIVWSLTGLWHGANFTFIAWGLIHFTFIAIEKFTGLEKKNGKILNVFKWIYTFIVILTGWVFFRADSVSHALSYLGCMFGLNGNSFVDAKFTEYLSHNYILILISAVLCTPVIAALGKKIKKNILWDALYVIAVLLLFVLSVACIAGDSYNPFIYFNF